MQETDFIKQFEACTLPKEIFDHRGHLWLGWLYIRDYSLKEASQRLCKHIDQFACSLGADTKFHKTLTVAFACLIKSRFKDKQSFEQFLTANPDLLTDAIKLIKKHYSSKRLESEQARINLIFPDLQDFPQEYKNELFDLTLKAN